jgi:hypothetical protein
MSPEVPTIKFIGFAIVMIAISVLVGYMFSRSRPTQLPSNEVEIIDSSSKTSVPADTATAPEKLRIERDVMCAQVITVAENPSTGDIREFPTPCDVPPGWRKIE